MNLTEKNYHSLEANQRFCSSSQYKDFYGSVGLPGCEARALATLKGEWVEKKKKTTAMMVGSYMDAHFSGTLATFKAQNPILFSKKDGSLKADYLHANTVIARIERDHFFMQTLSGQQQAIMTADFFGMDWKFKIDSFHPGKAIVDLKIMKSLTAKEWASVNGKNTKVSFIEYWGHDIQGAIYQRGVKEITGDTLPFLISGASKEKPEPDIEVFKLRQSDLDTALYHIETMAERLKKVKAGEIKPEKCGVCDYCRSMKVLTKPVYYDEV